MMSQSVDFISGSSGGVCLICNGSIDEAKISRANGYPSSSPLLSRDLYVYFIMRHVLDLPLEHLNRFMEQCPNIIDWVQVCDSCNENDLDKCKNLFLELLEVKKKFNDAKLEVALKIQRSYKKAKQVETICHVARQHVIKRIKQGHHLTDASRKGDLMAQEKLTSKISVRSCSNSKVNHSTYPTYLVESQVIRRKEDEDDRPVPHHDDQDSIDFELKLEPLSPQYTENKEYVEAKLVDYFEENCDSFSENALEDPAWDQDSFDPASPASSNAESGDGEDWMPKPRKGKCSRRKISKKSERIKTEDSSRRRTDLLPQNKRTQSSRRRQRKKFKGPTIRETKFLTYQCEDCGWRTKHSLLLKYHKKQVHGDGKTKDENPHSSSDHAADTSSSKDNVKVKITKAPKKCDQCGKEFGTSRSLLYHLGSIHGLNEIQKYTCTFPNCGKSFYTQHNLNIHETTHKPPQHKCDLCGVSFKAKQSLTAHMNGHEGTIEKPFKCDLCLAVFERKSYLSDHMKRCRSSGPSKKKCKLGEQGETKNNLLQNPTKTYVCELCGWKSTLAHSLRKHNNEAHGIMEPFMCKVEGCGKSFPKKVLLRKHEYYHEKTFQSKMLSLETDLRVHVGVEDGTSIKEESERREKGSEDAPPLCSTCGRVFPNKPALNSHVYRVHERKLEVCCDLCGKVMAHKYSLREHMAAVHKIGNPELQCKVEGCSRMFVRKKELDEHMETHAEVRSLVECQLCGKKFASKNSLSNHIRKIHRNGDRKPVK